MSRCRGAAVIAGVDQLRKDLELCDRRGDVGGDAAGRGQLGGELAAEPCRARAQPRPVELARTAAP